MGHTHTLHRLEPSDAAQATVPYPALLGACTYSAAAILFSSKDHGCLREAVEMFLKMSPNPPRLQEEGCDLRKTVRIMANGDLLYHDALYECPKGWWWAGDFRKNFTYVKDWLCSKETVLGALEGTIRSDHPWEAIRFSMPRVLSLPSKMLATKWWTWPIITSDSGLEEFLYDRQSLWRSRII